MATVQSGIKLAFHAERLSRVGEAHKQSGWRRTAWPKAQLGRRFRRKTISPAINTTAHSSKESVRGPLEAVLACSRTSFRESGFSQRLGILRKVSRLLKRKLPH